MNEVNMLNIGGVDYNIDDQHVRDLIAHSENGLDSQSNLPISSRHYDEGEYLIGQDRLYYEVTSDIEIGDVIAEGVNVRATIISEELVRLKNQSSIAVIQSIAKVESAALSSRNYVIGQYFYWDFGLAAGLYETIATITSGDAFSVGVNIKLANKIIDIVDGLSDAYNITGAKNLCPNNAVDTVTTDITWDVLSDGSIQVSGAPAANRFLELGYVTLPPGTYKVTTLAGQDEENSRVWLTVYAGVGYSNVVARSNSSSGTPNTFTSAVEATVKMALNVSSGSAINTRVFPMCRVASITDESYMPYAMTNKQLTTSIETINKTIYRPYKKVDISVITDGVKNYRTLLNNLYAQIDRSRITSSTKLIMFRPNSAEIIYNLSGYEESGWLSFGVILSTGAELTEAWSMHLHSSLSSRNCIRCTGSTVTGQSETSNVISSGLTLGIQY